MSITLITAIAAIIVAIVARIGYVCWYNDTLKQAKRAMRKAQHHEEMAELAMTDAETRDEYFKARLAYRRAARRFLKLGKRSSAKWAVRKAVEMNSLYEKYLYM